MFNVKGDKKSFWGGFFFMSGSRHFKVILKVLSERVVSIDDALVVVLAVFIFVCIFLFFPKCSRAFFLEASPC